MKTSLSRNLPFLLLTPYIIGFSPEDSSWTEYAVGVGGGQYAYQDCSGDDRAQSFGDVGIKMTHKFDGPIRIGATVTAISANKFGGVAYPDVALDWENFSFGTTGIRLGSENNVYGEFSLLDQVPALSGKGFARFGIGWNVPDSRTHLWLGGNGVPYKNTGLAAQVDFPVSLRHYLFINGRYGRADGVPEYGVSVGVRVRE